MGLFAVPIIALRNEKGSYNRMAERGAISIIIALRNEKGSYNHKSGGLLILLYYSTAK